MKILEKIVVRTMIAWGVFLLVISVIGVLCTSELKELSVLSTLFSESSSIRYTTLFQGLFVNFTISLYNIIFESPRICRRMLCQWKIIWRLIGSCAIAIFFVILFDWFPVNNLSAWIGFIVSFVICTGTAFGIMLYKTKKENEEMQGLFENYKRSHQREGQDYEND